MSTTDEIMALAGAFADAEDADFALHTLDELRAAVAALVAERDDALAPAASRLADGIEASSGSKSG